AVVLVLVVSLYSFNAAVPCFVLQDSASTGISALSLHDALPISVPSSAVWATAALTKARAVLAAWPGAWSSRRRMAVSVSPWACRSEEHTSELQSRENLVCRLLLEKKKIWQDTHRES